jgi:hypothetical protein
VRGGAVEEEGAVGELEGLLHPAVALPTVLAGGGGERQQGKKTVLPTVHSSHGPPPKEEEGEGRGRHGRREKANLGRTAVNWGARGTATILGECARERRPGAVQESTREEGGRRGISRVSPVKLLGLLFFLCEQPFRALGPSVSATDGSTHITAIPIDIQRLM